MSDELVNGSQETRTPEREPHPIAFGLAERREQPGTKSSSFHAVESLEEKLERQLAEARWIAVRIKELQPDWDELGFYRSVQPHPPARRLRRSRTIIRTD